MTLTQQRPAGVGFSFRSGRLCLDFAATLMFREAASSQELLETPTDLADWAIAAGAAVRPIAWAARDLVDAMELREAIYRSVAARIGGRPPARADRAVLNKHGRVAPTALALRPDGTVARSGSMESVLASVCWDWRLATC